MNNICPICKKIVLGLEGYDLCLDTFYLNETNEDIILADKLWGWVHGKCLQSHSLAPNWMNAIYDAKVKNGARQIWLDDDGFILHLENSDEYQIWLHNCFYLRLSHEATVTLKASGSILKTSPISLPLESLSFSARQLCNEIKAKSFKLGDILKDLDLQNHYAVSVLAAAALTPIKDDPDETFEALRDGYLEVEATYHVLLPEEANGCLAVLN